MSNKELESKMDFSDVSNRCVLYSAVELSDEKITILEQAILDRFGKEVNVLVEIDESLIGGYKLLLGDVVYDFSVRSGLESLRNHILEAR